MFTTAHTRSQGCTITLAEWSSYSPVATCGLPIRPENRTTCSRNPGESRWFPPLKHSVENLGDTPCNSIYIGMKAKPNVVKATVEPGDLVSDAETKALVAQVLGSMK